MSAVHLHVCMSADGVAECHAPSACYGEICVFRDLCDKREADLSRAELRRVNAVRRHLGEPPIVRPKP